MDGSTATLEFGWRPGTPTYGDCVQRFCAHATRKLLREEDSHRHVSAAPDRTVTARQGQAVAGLRPSRLTLLRLWWGCELLGALSVD
eukprot:1872402-Prymnesium_polylepis.1